MKTNTEISDFVMNTFGGRKRSQYRVFIRIQKNKNKIMITNSKGIGKENSTLNSLTNPQTIIKHKKETHLQYT